MDPVKRQNLMKLGAERLTDILLDLSGRNDEIAELVERLAATPEENIKRFKARLAGLKRAKRFIHRRESYVFARQLEDMLADLKAGTDDPSSGAELAARFFECDQAVFERCDDSNGAVGDVFRFSARNLFVYFASIWSDKKKLTTRLLRLYAQDGYGVRYGLLEAAQQFLPEEHLRALIERFWENWETETGDKYRARHWLLGVESLAGQLKDAPLFEKARLAAWPELSTAACLDIAQVYFDAGDNATALSWIERVPDGEVFQAYKRDNLLLAVYRELGDRAGMAETAWRVFRRNRSENTLEELLAVIGKDQREKVIGEETRAIQEKETLSYTDAGFLIQMGRGEEAEGYLLGRVNQLDGSLYNTLLPLAEALEGMERWLAASLLYRALLESILQRAQSKYYHHGVRYLLRLDLLAGRIANWQEVVSHAGYKEGLLEAHGRKSSFWAKYQA
ncbi:MAG: hypothetical protein GKR89_11685 [Candidatus Latescibacteria bacterium]|nr:hypothetical protein [Candidatus Latescibacterota bacterium]